MAPRQTSQPQPAEQFRIFGATFLRGGRAGRFLKLPLDPRLMEIGELIGVADTEHG
jgi:hypothetical protein